MLIKILLLFFLEDIPFWAQIILILIVIVVPNHPHSIFILLIVSWLRFKHTIEPIEVIKISPQMYLQNVSYLEFRILYILCRLYIIFYRVCLTKYIPTVTSAVSIKTTTIYIFKKSYCKISYISILIFISGILAYINFIAVKPVHYWWY